MALWPAKKGEEKTEDVPKLQLPPELQGAPGARESAGQPVAKPVAAGTPLPVAKPAPLEGAGGPDGLEQLTGNLGQVEKLLEAARQQVTDYLLYRESQTTAQTRVRSPEGIGEGLGEVLSKLDILAEGLEAVHKLAAAAPSKGAPGAAAGQPAVSEDVLKAVFQPLGQKIDTIEAGLQAVGQQTAGPGAEAAVAPVLTTLGQISEGINMHHEGVINTVSQVQAALGQLQGTIGQIQQHLDGGLQHIVQLLQPPEPEPEPETPEPVSSDWERAILGDALADNSSLAFQRQQLVEGVMSGERAAKSLVGQLIVFQSATTEKMAPLLKEIGEAYYRWQPKAEAVSNPFEETLVAWLQNACDEAGIGNKIELVNPGERFDSGRHTAAERGVEITQVLGWVVLRDNGRVYTKAAVAVK